MKVTRASVEEYAKSKGYDAVQIDGIPEGFAWKAPDITIGDTNYPGLYWAFAPLKHWDENQCMASAKTEEGLLEVYKIISK